MTEKTLAEEIITLVTPEIQKIPTNQKATIIKVYEDQKHADITTATFGLLRYVETYGNTPIVDNDCILIFLNGGLDEYVVIC